jgi:hypothetical protein
MEYLIETRSKRTKVFFEILVPRMLKELKLERSRKTLFIKVCRDGMDEHEGSTVALDPIDSYVVLIKPKSLKEMGITLAHEMVHVKQLAKGTLKNVNGVNFWNGKRFRKNHKYLNQPWEIEAFSKQELLFRKTIEK